MVILGGMNFVGKWLNGIRAWIGGALEPRGIKAKSVVPRGLVEPSWLWHGAWKAVRVAQPGATMWTRLIEAMRKCVQALKGRVAWLMSHWWLPLLGHCWGGFLPLRTMWLKVTISMEHWWMSWRCCDRSSLSWGTLWCWSNGSWQHK